MRTHAMSALGHSRPMHPDQDLTDVRCWSDCVAKVESCRATNFSRNMIREATANLYNLNRVTEVACEFNVRR